MTLRVSVSLAARDSLSRQVEELASKAIFEKTRTVAVRAVVIAEQIARRELYYDRPGKRRNSRYRYSSGFSADVVGVRMPLTVVLKNRAAHAEAIEKGQPPRVIRGRMKIPGRFPPATPGVTFADAYGSRSRTKINHVDWPGTEPHHIMERALRQAFKEAGADLRGAATTYRG